MLMKYCILLLFAFVAARHEPPRIPVGPFDKTNDNTVSPVGKPDSMFEGDIKVSGSEVGRAGSLNPWPNAVIPYHFDCSVKNIPSAIAATKKAMKEWEAKTCVRFVKKRPTDNAFLELIRGNGCWATRVGYTKDGKTQISIGNGCDYVHVMVHEIGHVLGFWHEQSRTDRDKYITIDFYNVIPALRYNFDKVTDLTKNYGQAYDYASIMHYPWNAFAIDSRRPTIRATRPLNGKVPYVKLSGVDAAQTNTMYKCAIITAARGVETRNMKLAASLVSKASTGSKCADTHTSCPFWARNGHCDLAPDPMLIFCAKSCANCGKCVDKHDKCEIWKNKGHCFHNNITILAHMLRRCKVSCSVCKPAPCVDDNKNCNAWSAHGYCSGSRYMREHCKKACGICTPGPTTQTPTTQVTTVKPCEDKNTKCKGWRKYCKSRKYQLYMTENCPKTCDKCSTGIFTSPTPSATTRRSTTQSTTQSTTHFTTSPPKKNKFTGVRCLDRSRYCPEWAKDGRCVKDRWVMENCLLSCERFDICDVDQIRPNGVCTSPLGVGWDNTLPDSNFVATSTFQPGGGWVARAHSGRLYREDDHTKKEVGAWCARPGSINQYLQIDLGGLKTITAVATQGRDRYFEHVKTYYLSFSKDLRAWEEYKENNEQRVFKGNCDHFTPVLNSVKNPQRARYIRFHPITQSGANCMRVEVYGC